jgi:adenylosuccinate synthase
MSTPRRKVRVIVDLQFGSTGKGLIAGWLAREHPCDVVCAAWRPNAGHTYIDPEGRKFVHTMLPNGIVSPNLQWVLIGPEAAINAEALAKEVVAASVSLGIDTNEFLKKLIIHPQAAIVLDQHRAHEKKFVKIGSTMKGSAAATMAKMERDPDGRATVGQNRAALGYGLSDCVGSVDQYNSALDSGKIIQVEGAQGHSLGINQRFYPYATSRECTATQVLSDNAIPASFNDVKVVGTVRTFPIRVANRFADECMMPADGSSFGIGALTPICGNRAAHMIHSSINPDRHDFSPRQIGTSGPCYPDQEETTFEAIGQPVELTTVTKLPRRVFTFSEKQLQEAVRMSSPDYIFLNFMNYLPREKWVDFVSRVSNLSIGAGGGRVAWIGTGPAHGNVEVW